MENELDIGELIKKGGVIFNAKGETPAELYKIIAESQPLPEYLSSEMLYTELMQREELISTAVGNGLALPHPRYPLLKNEDEQRIIVCYPKKAISMEAPDPKPVFVFFTILSSTSKVHLKILSRLAYLIQNKEFCDILAGKPSADFLADAVNRILPPEDKRF
ncbi:MAG: PTS sugar transporter subunit IIA [Treponemataceae bacterium]|nr:PTS sugar transporter subunit IIA [Treponemataceae bacterium]